MKVSTLVSALALVASAAGPALAWDNTNVGPGPKSIADGGPSQAQSAVSRSTSRSISSAHATQRVVVNNTNAYSGEGGSAGSGYVGTIDNRSAPSIFLPSIGGGGSDCPVVGFGIGGSGQGGGGGFGPSWISSDCNTRKVAAMAASLGYHDAAIALLRKHFPELDEVMESQKESAASRGASKASKPEYCFTASPAELRRHPECQA